MEKDREFGPTGGRGKIETVAREGEKKCFEMEEKSDFSSGSAHSICKFEPIMILVEALQISTLVLLS